MIVGYQAEHTLGRKLVERNPEVAIHGELHKLKCEVAVMNSFSAHADKNELLEYLSPFEKSELKNIFLVHGDEDQSEKFAAALRENKFQNVDIPKRLDKFEV
jgi:metallo-beta-lactamase family protein